MTEQRKTATTLHDDDVCLTKRRHRAGFTTASGVLLSLAAVAIGCSSATSPATTSPAASNGTDGGAAATGEGGGTSAGDAGTSTSACVPKKSTCAPADVVLNPAVSYPLTSPDGALNFAVGDFNGDGKADIVLDVMPTGLEVLLNNGDGTFGKGTVIEERYSSLRGAVIAAADVDGDCKADVVVPSQGLDTTIDVRLSKGDGTFQAPVQTHLASGYLDAIVPADLNHDGRVDLAFSEAISMNTGHGTFGAVADYQIGGQFAIGDLTGDGAPEIVSRPPTTGMGGACVWKNDGSGNFPQQPVCYPTSDDDIVLGFAVGDVNGDGKGDVVVGFQQTSQASGQMNVLLGKGDGTLQDHLPYGGLPLFYDAIQLADMNNDGKPDFIAYFGGAPLSMSNIGFTVLMNDGTGKFTGSPVTHPVGGVGGGHSIGAYADFLGNGLIGMAAYNDAKKSVDVIVASCRK